MFSSKPPDPCLLGTTPSFRGRNLRKNALNIELPNNPKLVWFHVPPYAALIKNFGGSLKQHAVLFDSDQDFIRIRRPVVFLKSVKNHETNHQEIQKNSLTFLRNIKYTEKCIKIIQLPTLVYWHNKITNHLERSFFC